MQKLTEESESQYKPCSYWGLWRRGKQTVQIMRGSLARDTSFKKWNRLKIRETLTMRVNKHWSRGCEISILEDMSSHGEPEEHPFPDCSCSDTNLRDTSVQKVRTAFGPAQASADKTPSGTFCKGHLLVKNAASPKESVWSHAEAGW